MAQSNNKAADPLDEAVHDFVQTFWTNELQKTLERGLADINRRLTVEKETLTHALQQAFVASLCQAFISDYTAAIPTITSATEQLEDRQDMFDAALEDWDGDVSSLTISCEEISDSEVGAFLGDLFAEPAVIDAWNNAIAPMAAYVTNVTEVNHAG